MILDAESPDTQALIAIRGQPQVLDLTRGNWLFGVIYLDTEAGICRHYRTVLGQPIIDPATGQYVVEERRGRFAVVWPEDSSDSQT